MKLIDKFKLNDFDEVSQLQADVSEKALKYENVFVKERIESNVGKIKQKRKKKKKAGLFGGGFSLKKGINFIFGDGDDKIEYIDFVSGKLTFRTLRKTKRLTMCRST